MDDWLSDPRDIVAVRLPAETRDYDWHTGDRFERIQYAGEYCYVPWLRITSPYTVNGIYGGPTRTFEVPLNAVAMVQYAAQADRSGDAGETRSEAEGLDPKGESTVGAEGDDAPNPSVGDAQPIPGENP